MKIKIENRLIGEGKTCFIIAEAGVNHNGRLELAKKLVDVAVDACADAIKFQTFKAEDVVTKDAGLAKYARDNIGKDMKQIDLIKKFELRYEDFKILKEYCEKKEIMFLSTPHSLEAIDILEPLVSAYKIGSGDITNIPALKYAAKKGKPMILGAGMSNLKEVKSAVNAIKSEGNNQIIVLHCTTNYPCPFEEVNLNAMKTMQEKLDCLVGYSDHTMGITIPIMATTLGAVIIEKHFTLDRNMHGPDHKASLEPDELKNMVEEIRNVEKALGSFDKKPTVSEKSIINYARKSVVAKNNIKKGTVIEENMITIKRPGDGIGPKFFDKVIGKKSKRDINEDEMISWEFLE